jgi:prepilin-type N-terminal cleavage/methylation domain-containing protein
MRRLRTDDSGFSLIELLAAMLVAGILLTAVMNVFINGVKGASRVQDRVDSQQRGRLAMDRVTSLLSSQVCLSSSIPPVVGGTSTDKSVTFYGDLQGASNTPSRYTLTWSAAAKTLTEYQYTAASGSLTSPPIVWSGTPAVTRLIASNVWPAQDDAGTDLPVFSYYRFEADGTVNLANPIALNGSSQLALADADDVVQVGVAFRVVPAKSITSVDARSTSITGQALAGSASPASPAAGPNCQ